MYFIAKTKAGRWDGGAPGDDVTDTLGGRPWWKKKRWAAALGAWVVVAYPLSAGPALYVFERDPVPGWVANPLAGLYAPLEAWVEGDLPMSGPLIGYVEWWRAVAAASDGRDAAPGGEVGN